MSFPKIRIPPEVAASVFWPHTAAWFQQTRADYEAAVAAVVQTLDVDEATAGHWGAGRLRRAPGPLGPRCRGPGAPGCSAAGGAPPGSRTRTVTHFECDASAVGPGKQG